MKIQSFFSLTYKKVMQWKSAIDIIQIIKINKGPWTFKKNDNNMVVQSVYSTQQYNTIKKIFKRRFTLLLPYNAVYPVHIMRNLQKKRIAGQYSTVNKCYNIVTRYWLLWIRLAFPRLHNRIPMIQFQRVRTTPR